MAFALWSLPSSKSEWIAFFIGGAVFLASVFLFWKFNYLEGLESLANLSFWIMFFLFWGVVVFSVIQWIFQKLFHTS